MTAVANATPGFEDRLAQRSADLAPAERRVAQQLLELGAGATLLSAAALAEQLGTSDATIVRTAKALGYSGLADLRRALAAHGINPPPGERLRRTLEETAPRELAATLEHQLSGLDALARNVSADQFDDIVSVLATRERIVWRGVGPSAHLAAYGQVLTERIGMPSRALVHTGTSFADELLALGAGDAVLVLAYGRVQPHVRVLVARAASLSIPVVLVTDTLAKSLQGKVYATLQSGRGAPGLFASHGTTIVLIEALVLGIAAVNRTRADASMATLNELRAELAGRRLDVDTP